MKGLIVKPYWADLILSGEKSIELRSSNTNIRGRIGIIKSGTKKVYGEADLVDSREITDEEYYNLVDKHRVNVKREDVSYKKIYAWTLENPVLYKEPKEYDHKLGCVIWVNL